MKYRAIVGLWALVTLVSLPAQAAVNLVVNGGFEAETINNVAGSVSSEFGNRYNNGSVQLTGWTTNGYSLVFTPNTADTSGAATEFGTLQLWGPNSGSANGLTGTSPTGGNFVASDGAYGTAPITQTIGGLTVGAQYQLSFYWAAAQQKGWDGTTTENWTVSFGNQSYTTATVTNASHGFVPWQQQVYSFTASAVSQTLSFLAAGTPSGTPPFSLLDGVVLTAAPEPASWLLMLVGLGGLGVLMRRRVAVQRGPALLG